LPTTNTRHNGFEKTSSVDGYLTFLFAGESSSTGRPHTGISAAGAPLLPNRFSEVSTGSSNIPERDSQLREPPCASFMSAPYVEAFASTTYLAIFLACALIFAHRFLARGLHRSLGF
jgi:hypothetical protein